MRPQLVAFVRLSGTSFDACLRRIRISSHPMKTVHKQRTCRPSQVADPSRKVNGLHTDVSLSASPLEDDPTLKPKGGLPLFARFDRMVSIELMGHYAQPYRPLSSSTFSGYLPAARFLLDRPTGAPSSM